MALVLQAQQDQLGLLVHLDLQVQQVPLVLPDLLVRQVQQEAQDRQVQQGLTLQCQDRQVQQEAQDRLDLRDLQDRKDLRVQQVLRALQGLQDLLERQVLLAQQAQ